jgi:hypothetical protein
MDLCAFLFLALSITYSLSINKMRLNFETWVKSFEGLVDLCAFLFLALSITYSLSINKM